MISSNVHIYTNLVISVTVLQRWRAVISADRHAARAPVHAVGAWFLAWKRSGLLPTAFLRATWVTTLSVACNKGNDGLSSARASLILRGGAREADCNFVKLEFHAPRHSHEFAFTIRTVRSALSRLKKVKRALLVPESLITPLRKLMNFLATNSNGILAKQQEVDGGSKGNFQKFFIYIYKREVLL